MIRGLPIAAGLGLLTGCLIPFPIEEEPVEVNEPPFVDVRTVSPVQGLLDYDREADGAEVAFEVGSVDDPNAGDVLFYRWFVEFDPDGGGRVFQGVLRPAERGAIDFQYDPCQQPREGGETLQKVELIVSDRAFLDGSIGQAVPEDAGVAHLIWFVRLDDRRCTATLGQGQ